MLSVSLVMSFPAVCSVRAQAAASQVGSAGVATVTLSNLHTLSRWAYPLAAATVRAEPSAHARALGRLGFLTPEGQAEPYLALRASTIEAVTWILISLPRRPNGLSGWVPATALSQMHVTREYLRVDRETLRAQLFRGGHAVWSAPVGVGRSAYLTPAGHFFVTEKLTTLDDPFYGPYALGTSAYAPTLSDWPGGGVVGIHGTDEPQLIPGRPSHGCIRLRNADITSLWRLVEAGTPIEVV
jgi:hypothetical protein